MTPELESRLTHIESLCHACLALDAKATTGPWTVEQSHELGVKYWIIPSVIRGTYGDNSIDMEGDQHTAAFIVQARDLCPRTAKSTLTAIAALREIAALPTGQESSADQCSAVVRAMYALTKIASHFDA